MSRELKSVEIPDKVQELFHGKDLFNAFGLGYELATVDDNGWPRLSMLSHGEILVIDSRRVRLALWENTNTGKNLASGRPCLLSIVMPHSVYYLGGHGRILGSRDQLDLFELNVEVIRADQHAGLPVTGPIRFESDSEETLAAVLDQWREQMAALRDL